jgi:hypothetical protein
MSSFKLWILFVGCLGFSAVELFALTTKRDLANDGLIWAGLFLFLGGCLVAVTRLLELRLQYRPTIKTTLDPIIVPRSRLVIFLKITLFGLLATGLLFLAFAADTSGLRFGGVMKPGALILSLISMIALPILLGRLLKRDIDIIVGATGIQDHLTGFGQIAWKDIVNAEIEDNRPGQKIVLQLQQPEKYLRKWSQKIIDRLMISNRKNSIAFSMAGVVGNPDYLLAVIKARAEIGSSGSMNNLVKQ